MQIPLYAIFNLEDERGRDNFISLVDLLTKEGIVLRVSADVSKMVTVEFSVSSECISFGGEHEKL